MSRAKTSLLILVLGCRGRTLIVEPPLPPPPGFGPLPYADIDPDSAAANPGDTVRFRVLSVTGAAPDRVVWRVADTTFATIDSLGLMTARAAGTTTVQAQASRGTTITYVFAPIWIR